MNDQACVLLTGASGFLGRHFADLCRHSGFPLKAAVRKYATDLCIAQSAQCIIGDIHAQTQWQDALRDCATVVHMAARVHVMKESSQDPLQEFRAINVAGTLNLARQAASQGIKRFLFISSIKVNGEKTTSGQPYTPEVEQAPDDPYGLSKYEAEEGLRQIAADTAMEVVIIRPPMIYGPGVKGNFDRLIRLLKKGYPLPLLNIDNKRSFVSIYNLCDLMLRCLTHPAAANQTFLVSDNQDLSTSELLYKIAEAMGVRPRMFWCPKALLQSGAAVLGKKNEAARLLDSLQVDVSDTMACLDWQPAVSVEEGLQWTLRGL